MSDKNKLYERHAGDWHEWSIDTTGSIAEGKPSRMFLRSENGGKELTVTEAPVTSHAPTARALAGTENTRLFLTSTLAAWLYEVLGKALGVTVGKVSLEILRCTSCGKLGVSISDRRITEHKCAGSWSIEHHETVDAVEVIGALQEDL